MSMDFWNNFWTALGVLASTAISTIAIGISIKASKQTEKQIELGNKYHLFDKRVEVFWEIVSLQSACKDISNFANQTKINDEYIDEILRTLTRATPFKNVYTLSSIRVDKNTSKETKVLQDYIQDLGKLLSVVEKSLFLFGEEEVTIALYKFVFSYNELLQVICDTYCVNYSLSLTEEAAEKVKKYVENLDSSYKKFIETDPENRLRNMIRII